MSLGVDYSINKAVTRLRRSPGSYIIAKINTRGRGDFELAIERTVQDSDVEAFKQALDDIDDCRYGFISVDEGGYYEPVSTELTMVTYEPDSCSGGDKFLYSAGQGFIRNQIGAIRNSVDAIDVSDLDYYIHPFGRRSVKGRSQAREVLEEIRAVLESENDLTPVAGGCWTLSASECCSHYDGRSHDTRYYQEPCIAVSPSYGTFTSGNVCEALCWVEGTCGSGRGKGNKNRVETWPVSRSCEKDEMPFNPGGGYWGRGEEDKDSRFLLGLGHHASQHGILGSGNHGIAASVLGRYAGGPTLSHEMHGTSSYSMSAGGIQTECDDPMDCEGEEGAPCRTDADCWSADMKCLRNICDYPINYKLDANGKLIVGGGGGGQQWSEEDSDDFVR